MPIKIFEIAEDKVINSVVATGKANYGFALDKLFPLTNRFSAQRKIQDKKFYRRLERDILNGCLMPALTIAFVDKNLNFKSSTTKTEQYINKNINNGYILDGIQRLNTLSRISDNADFQRDLPIYLNVIIAPTADKLLYRMITLNNGQRPMTPRHQIEILTQELFDFDNIDIDVQTEKERSEHVIKGSFNLGDISKAYLAFLTNSVNNENNKIIDEKMDQIIVGRILDTEEDEATVDFKSTLELISKLCSDIKVKKWMKISNNLIGFCVGIKISYNDISNISPEEFLESIDLFDEAFKGINPSKVNLGKFRRMLSKEFIENYTNYSKMDEIELIEQFMEMTS